MEIFDFATPAPNITTTIGKINIANDKPYTNPKKNSPIQPILTIITPSRIVLFNGYSLNMRDEKRVPIK